MKLFVWVKLSCWESVIYCVFMWINNGKVIIYKEKNLRDIWERYRAAYLTWVDKGGVLFSNGSMGTGHGRLLDMDEQ